MDSRFYPQEAAVRATIYKAIARERRAQGVRGDQLVELYENAAAEEAATRLRLSVAEQICAQFSGTPMELYFRVRKDVPSAKPCRMGSGGLGGTEARQQLRIGDIEGWGLKRLLGVAASLGLEPVIELRQKRRVGAIGGN